MRTKDILVTLVLALRGTQAHGVYSLIAALPSCSLACLSSALADAGCALGDISCNCGTQRTLVQGFARPCIEAACTEVEVASMFVVFFG